MSKIAVVYWSGTGNTESMAEAIAKGARSAGAEVDVLSVGDASVDKLKGYDKLAFGCPSMGDEVLEESEFEPFFADVEGSISGIKVALFGSYGWGDGQWMRDWQKRTEDNGAQVFEEGFIQNDAPDEALCEEFGARFAAF